MSAHIISRTNKFIDILIYFQRTTPMIQEIYNSFELTKDGTDEIIKQRSNNCKAVKSLSATKQRIIWLHNAYVYCRKGVRNKRFTGHQTGSASITVILRKQWNSR